MIVRGLHLIIGCLYILELKSSSLLFCTSVPNCEKYWALWQLFIILSWLVIVMKYLILEVVAARIVLSWMKVVEYRYNKQFYYFQIWNTCCWKRKRNLIVIILWFELDSQIKYFVVFTKGMIQHHQFQQQGTQSLCPAYQEIHGKTTSAFWIFCSNTEPTSQFQMDILLYVYLSLIHNFQSLVI